MNLCKSVEAGADCDIFSSARCKFEGESAGLIWIQCRILLWVMASGGVDWVDSEAITIHSIQVGFWLPKSMPRREQEMVVEIRAKNELHWYCYYNRNIQYASNQTSIELLFLRNRELVSSDQQAGERSVILPPSWRIIFFSRCIWSCYIP